MPWKSSKTEDGKSLPADVRVSKNSIKRTECKLPKTVPIVVMCFSISLLILGLVEACIMHPLDLVKIRLQIGGGHFTGLGDVLRKTVKNEGFLGFYKGILPPLLIETPKGATKFFAFEQYKQAFDVPSVPQWMVSESQLHHR